MARRMMLLIAAGVMATTISLPAHADHCNGTVTAVVVNGQGGYLDDRGVGNTWVYLETNNTAGLQSGGESVVLGADDADDCAHANPDTLIV